MRQKTKYDVSQGRTSVLESISLVICTKNRCYDLKECLDSIARQTIFPEELIVVDSSTDRMTEQLIEDYKKVLEFPIRYIHTEPGLTKQRNIGAKSSKYEIVAFIDDDVILYKDYLEKIKIAFSISKKILGVGGRVVNVPSETKLNQYLKKIFFYTEYSDKLGILKKSGFARFPCGDNKNEILPTQVLIGCSFSFRKEVFNHLSFDEYFSGYSVMEDLEFSYRVNRIGKLCYTPAAKLIHKKTPTDRQSISKRLENLIINHYYVFKKLLIKKKIDWMYFWWSQFGFFIYSFQLSYKIKTAMPIIGVISGYSKLFKKK